MSDLILIVLVVWIPCISFNIILSLLVLRALKEIKTVIESDKYRVIVVPDQKPILAMFHVTGLQGGAIQYHLPDGSISVHDIDGEADWIKRDMIVVFQEA